VSGPHGSVSSPARPADGTAPASNCKESPQPAPTETGIMNVYCSFKPLYFHFMVLGMAPRTLLDQHSATGLHPLPLSHVLR
jgi:hypothetical protein